MKYRINGFEQIKAFYSLVFEQKYEIKPQHISLYVFLINQNNRNNWVEWFKCPYDLAMSGACIGNKKTYYNCLNDLQEWKLIKYKKGVNEWKAPAIKLEVLKCTATATATVPQSVPLLQPLPIPLPTHIYKHITNNIYSIEELKEMRSFIDKFLDDKKEPKTIRADKSARAKNFYNDIAEEINGKFFAKYPNEVRKFYEYWSESGKNDKKLRFEKEKSFNINLRLKRWFFNAKINEVGVRYLTDQEKRNKGLKSTLKYIIADNTQGYHALMSEEDKIKKGYSPEKLVTIHGEVLEV